ncbi:MAG TPA: hypothetical protein VNQ90_18325 [Chthoniobacteraceae bacterium]|nr:hypothetical protein [Chthoniobacteraceae bacterium]
MTPTNPSSPSLEVLFRKSTCYAGIGSRHAPEPVLFLIDQIAGVLADHGLMLRSGGAPGADTAFEAGCDRRRGKKEIFLPWKGFNRNPSLLCEPTEEAQEVAALVHPNWRACRPTSRHLHARNVQQVYGREMDNPVDFVLFWAPEENGKVQGGTATAVHFAREMNIPTFNLWECATLERWKESIAAHPQGKRPLWSRFFTQW